MIVPSVNSIIVLVDWGAKFVSWAQVAPKPEAAVLAASVTINMELSTAELERYALEM